MHMILTTSGLLFFDQIMYSPFIEKNLKKMIFEFLGKMARHFYDCRPLSRGSVHIIKDTETQELNITI